MKPIIFYDSCHLGVGFDAYCSEVSVSQRHLSNEKKAPGSLFPVGAFFSDPGLISINK